MRIINTILLVLILLVVSGGAAYYYFFGQGQPLLISQEPEQPAVGGPIYLALEPFTVTLQGERNSQIFYTELTLRLDETRSHTILVQYMPEVRNRVLAELAQHSASDLKSIQGRDALVERLKTILAAPYPPQMSVPSISSVLFTAFVIQ
ncbi:MAG TPA: flagellar basal body-associated FliL family protein [Pusillimonas sp.]|uniref:flagellar basal body-associated FliL family protein n=1 Tax=unclassified Pusillimonas TaxID=2640016 RepID=UPI00262F94A7|nr:MULTISPECIES: flagellar basal body-associated FliL family protein [unclassified Pusillimonas]HLU18554.1 flagellar basal body-associated FliL family protein [Pusillimonas sp.]